MVSILSTDASSRKDFAAQMADRGFWGETWNTWVSPWEEQHHRFHLRSEAPGTLSTRRNAESCEHDPCSGPCPYYMGSVRL